MLFDPKLQKPTLAGFISWLETKDPNETYIWIDYKECACGQYMAALGIFSSDWVRSPGVLGKLNRLAMPRQFAISDTFGNLLARARTALARV
jgi:hypothetical protein